MPRPENEKTIEYRWISYDVITHTFEINVLVTIHFIQMAIDVAIIITFNANLREFSIVAALLFIFR